jgi:hypothetical protein
MSLRDDHSLDDRNVTFDVNESLINAAGSCGSMPLRLVRPIFPSLVNPKNFAADDVRTDGTEFGLR